MARIQASRRLRLAVFQASNKIHLELQLARFLASNKRYLRPSEISIWAGQKAQSVLVWSLKQEISQASRRLIFWLK